MKWRTTVVYFLVFLLIAGVYLVIDSRKKETALKEKESRRVFVFDPGRVKEIEIKPRETEAIYLEKGDKWRISRPISSDVAPLAYAAATIEPALTPVMQWMGTRCFSKMRSTPA